MNTTPMIDVVFLLLTFFVMTFKIITPEGDFDVSMKQQGQAAAADVPKEPVRIYLTAKPDGLLAGIRLNETPVADFRELREQVKALVQAKPDLEAELLPDQTLNYEFVVSAISAINGEVRNGQVHKICDKIKFVRQN